MAASRASKRAGFSVEPGERQQTQRDAARRDNDREDVLFMFDCLVAPISQGGTLELAAEARRGCQVVLAVQAEHPDVPVTVDYNLSNAHERTPEGRTGCRSPTTP
jgi:hypothetical protein